MRTLTTLSTVAVGVSLIPLGYLVVRTTEAGWDRILAEILTPATGELAVRSLLLSAVVTAACLVLGVGAAFLVTRTDLPMRRFFGVLAALPLAIPTYVAGFAWVSTVDDFEGFWPAALVLTACSYPYVFLPVAAALLSADPAGEEVARSLGHSPWRSFTGVTLRQVRPAIAAGGLLVALYVLSDFGAVSIVRTQTFTHAIFTSFNLGFDRTGALVLSTVLVCITSVLLLGEGLSRKRGTRYARIGGSGRPPGRVSLRGWTALAITLLVGMQVVALGIPAVSMLRWFADGVSRPGSFAEIVTAAGNSLLVSLLGAGLTLALALPIGMLSTRSRGRFGAAVERLTYLSHALPGLVIGLSLVFFGIHLAYPLYQTVWLLALAYAALFLPLAAGAVASAFAHAPPSLEEVARSLGSSPARVLRTVTVPLVAPGLGAGAALAFLTCMKELPATLLLRPTGMDTLATELWTHTAVAEYAAAAPYAVLLVGLASVPTFLLTSRVRNG